MEWSCAEGKHKSFTFNESGREYCKKCGKLLRDYPKEVADSLIAVDQFFKDMEKPKPMQLWNATSWGTVEYL